MSSIPQDFFFNPNISKKKYLVLISRCEGRIKLRGKERYQFHFKGFVWGSRVDRVLVEVESKLVLGDYKIHGELIDIYDHVLHMRSIRLEKLSDTRVDIF